MNRDAALMELYTRLSSRSAPKPGSFSALTPAGRREYFTDARRRNRAKERAKLDNFTMSGMAWGRPGRSSARMNVTESKTIRSESVALDLELVRFSNLDRT